MLARARESIAAAGLTTIDLVRADATSLPRFADASFDLVLCSAGLLYLPIQVALREWLRLLAPGGLVAFSTMRAGFPAAARLFREHAGAYGLALTDPAAPLGTAQRCRQALQDAGFTPAATVEETIRFTRDDLRYAWDAHVDGPHHDAVATLTAEQARRFRAGYTSALDKLLSTAEGDLLAPQVIYASGRKPAPY